MAGKYKALVRCAALIEPGWQVRGTNHGPWCGPQTRPWATRRCPCAPGRGDSLVQRHSRRGNNKGTPEQAPTRMSARKGRWAYWNKRTRATLVASRVRRSQAAPRRQHLYSVRRSQRVSVKCAPSAPSLQCEQASIPCARGAPRVQTRRAKRVVRLEFRIFHHAREAC